ncbi:MAG: 1-deoxy-D-xylulose-5-phosphate reductoisomerase, partial [Gammaproteobacteria bacterium]|nr:1-deoxy-D-xylulose-5-phosphate reductoisomerase [Gammaproteobacteria bacterium]
AADTSRYPCLALACEALQTGGTAPAVLNAANEVAVQAFLDRRIPFLSIPEVIEQTLGHVTARAADSLDSILADDALAREHAAELITSVRVTVAR